MSDHRSRNESPEAPNAAAGARKAAPGAGKTASAARKTAPAARKASSGARNSRYGKQNAPAAAVSPSASRFNWLLIPLAAIMGIVPLIVRVSVYATGLENEDFFDSSTAATDLFLRVKAFWFIGLCVVLSFILVYILIRDGREIRFTKIFIPIGVYVLAIILSTFVSENITFSLTGGYEQFESMWVLLGYCITAYYAYLIVQNTRDLSFLMGVLTVSTVIILLIGFTQAFGTDFFKTSLGQLLIIPSKYSDLNGNFTFNFEEGRVYLTLYNPNYVGSYASLLIPVYVGLLLADKKVWRKILYGLIAVCLMVVLYFSLSRAGFIGVIAGLFMLLIMFNRQMIKHWYPSLLMLIIFVGTLYTLNNYSDGAVLDRLESALDISNVSVIDPSVSDIETLDDRVSITYKGNTFYVMFEYDSEIGYFYIAPLDASGNLIDSTVNDDGITYCLQDERFSGIYIYPQALENDVVGFSVNINGKDWYFANVNGSYYYRSPYGKLVKMRSSETVPLLEKYGHYVSGRFFIWARTLPLLKDHILLGSGPDTFVYVFPNCDFRALYYGGYEAQIMTKPHNIYLQIGVQTGVVSMLAFMIFYLWYFFSSLRLYMKVKKYDLFSLLGIGIQCGTFGYMVVGIINDSTIAVAPLYWSLIGLGLACNHLYRKSHDQEVLITEPEAPVPEAPKGKRGSRRNA